VSGRFVAAHAAAPDWEIAASQCLAALGPQPSHGLGFLYATEAFAPSFGDLHAYVRERTGVRAWIGTVGVGICAPGTVYFEEPALSLMVAPLEPDSFRLLARRGARDEVLSHAERAWAERHGARFAVVHADPRTEQLGRAIHGLAGALDGFLVGGLTSSRGCFPQVAETVGEGGLSGVLLSGAVPVATALSQSCAPIGPVHEITACEQNLLLELDGRPALEVFLEDAGELLARDLRRAAGSIFAALPVRGTDTADYLVRNLLGIDPERKLIAIGERVGPGDSLLWVRRDQAAARQDFQRMLRDLARRAGHSIKGGLYYSCLARGPNLFATEAEELAMIREVLGDFPLTGFYCNGEISHDRLYGYTGVLTLFL